MTEQDESPFAPDKRHHKRRATDLPPGPKRWRHRLAIALARAPVMAGMLIGVAIAAIALVMVLQVGAKNRVLTVQNHTLSVKTQRDERRIAALVLSVQNQRERTTGDFCRRININARASNAQTDTVNAIIIRSVTSSKPFDKFYRSIGAPPYKVRLRQARALTRKLVKQKVPVLNCRKLVGDIRKATQKHHVKRIAKGG